MDRRDGSTETVGSDAHSRAAAAFVDRLDSGMLDEIEDVILFGSTARGDAADLSSDVDFLLVVSDSSDKRTIEGEARSIAYDVMLEYGPVVEVHVVTRSHFEKQRNNRHPFFDTVLREGRSYA